MKKALLCVFLVISGVMLSCSTQANDMSSFNDYLHKVYIPCESNLIDLTSKETICFRLDSIKENKLIGKCGLYSRDAEIVDNMIPMKLEGFIKGKEASCKIYKEESEIGNLNIVLHENGEIEGQYIINNQEEKLLYRTYKKSDFDEKMLVEENDQILWSMDYNDQIEVKTSIEPWGSVIFLGGQHVGRKSYPIVLMLDTDYNILYRFKAPFQVRSVVKQIDVNDYNSDGRMDVKIVTCLEEDVEWTRFFVQTDENEFVQETLN